MLEDDDYRPSKNTTLNGKYTIKKLLGYGGYSCVWKCRYGIDYAIKINKCSDYVYDCVKNELTLLKFLKYDRCPNLLVPLDSFILKDGDIRVKKYYCVVYDLCDYGLDKLIDSGYLAKNHIKVLASDILNGIITLHSYKLIHGDLKPDNILIKNGIAKIADYSSLDYEYVFKSQIIGTRYYRPPEMILGMNLTMAIDMWAFGCILFEMATGEILFKASSKFAKIITSGEDHLIKIIKYIGPIPIYMLNGYNAKKYFSKRSNGNSTRHCKKIKYMGFTNKLTHMEPTFIDLIERCLEIDPLKRITAKECLDHPYFKIEN